MTTIRNDAPASPCIDVCQLDRNNYCQGCHRHALEIGAWSRMTAEEQRQVIELCRKRAEVGTTS